MAESKLPYINAYGNVTKVLEKIHGAATPDRFSQDFLADTLGMKGGSSRPVTPYLKRTGFLGTDVFEQTFASRKAVERVTANLNTLRGPIAHCTPLADDEVVRLRLSVRDWFRLHA